MSKEELRVVLTKARVKEPMIEDMLTRAYDDPYINRLGAQEYLKILDDSGLDVLLIDGRSNGALHRRRRRFPPISRANITRRTQRLRSRIPAAQERRANRRMGRLIEPSAAA